VSLDKGDYERLKNIARASAYVKLQNNDLQKENKQLKHENKQLKQEKSAYEIENRKLKRKVTVLERMVDRVKEHLEPEFNHISFMIGYIKADISKRMRFQKEDVIDLRDKKEIEGAEMFEHRLKEVEKENELEL
jgi:uncharacterized protein (DUF3084 family)